VLGSRTDVYTVFSVGYRSTVDGQNESVWRFGVLCVSLKEVCWETSSLAYRRETLLNHESRPSESFVSRYFQLAMFYCRNPALHASTMYSKMVLWMQNLLMVYRSQNSRCSNRSPLVWQVLIKTKKHANIYDFLDMQCGHKISSVESSFAKCKYRRIRRS